METVKFAMMMPKEILETDVSLQMYEDETFNEQILTSIDCKSDLKPTLCMNFENEEPTTVLVSPLEILKANKKAFKG